MRVTCERLDDNGTWVARVVQDISDDGPIARLLRDTKSGPRIIKSVTVTGQDDTSHRYMAVTL